MHIGIVASRGTEPTQGGRRRPSGDPALPRTYLLLVSNQGQTLDGGQAGHGERSTDTERGQEVRYCVRSSREAQGLIPPGTMMIIVRDIVQSNRSMDFKLC